MIHSRYYTTIHKILKKNWEGHLKIKMIHFRYYTTIHKILQQNWEEVHLEISKKIQINSYKALKVTHQALQLENVEDFC